MGIFDGIIEWFQNLGKPNDVDDTYLISELKKMDDDEELRMYREIVKQAEAAKPEDKEFVYKDEYVPLDDNTLKQNSYDKYSPDYESSTKAVEKNYDEKLQNIEKKRIKTKVMLLKRLIIIRINMMICKIIIRMRQLKVVLQIHQ